MRYGFILPGGTGPEQLAQAKLAEESGWDAVFVWEAAYGVDAWSLLAAMAQATDNVLLGTMLTPLPWRRPWKVASQAATLQELSGGRAVLAVGLGAISTGLGRTGEVLDRAERAELLDEGIDLIRSLWAGDMTFKSKHFDVDLSGREDLAEVLAAPLDPPIPIWCVGAWPRPKSMRRIVRCEGLLPVVMEGGGFRTTYPDDIREMAGWLRANGAPANIDIIMEGETKSGADTKAVQKWADVGCTWWLESRWEMPHHSKERLNLVRRRIKAGPPRLPADRT